MQDLKITTKTTADDLSHSEEVTQRWAQPTNITVTADVRGGDIHTSLYLLGGEDEDIETRRFDIDWRGVNIVTNAKNARFIAEGILERLKAVEA